VILCLYATQGAPSRTWPREGIRFCVGEARRLRAAPDFPPYRGGAPGLVLEVFRGGGREIERTGTQKTLEAEGQQHTEDSSTHDQGRHQLNLHRFQTTHSHRQDLGCFPCGSPRFHRSLVELLGQSYWMVSLSKRQKTAKERRQPFYLSVYWTEPPSLRQTQT
jgi:hypothetical protein